MRLVLALAVLASAAPVARAQDRDADRVPDAVDLCPDAREPRTTLFPGDGCPEADADHDGIVDDYDVCPASAETQNGYHDLDGCPDSVPSTAMAVPVEGTRVGCWLGATLVGVTATESGSALLVPRADAPDWLGAATLACYAGLAFDGRTAIHCATSDGAREATLVFRTEDAHAIGWLAVRTATGIERRAWSATRGPAFDRSAVVAAVAARNDALDACYTATLRAAAITGRVTVRVTVGTSGETSGVVVVSDDFAPAHPEVAACVVRLVDALTIATPPVCGAVTVTFPLAFEMDP